ncbi:hypothetical protein V5F44_19730 [Xanthobacter sp. V2C-8]|uniref:hypothetical protein n=1 Tax=Xanthobacter albus TaxID=3119929 RepID=UPI0037297AD7
MTKITVTRMYSGFSNVADSFSLGNMEHEGNAAASSYDLPDGYTVDGGVLYDPMGYACEIIAGHGGSLTLVSRAGTHGDTEMHLATA